MVQVEPAALRRRKGPVVVPKPSTLSPPQKKAKPPAPEPMQRDSPPVKDNFFNRFCCYMFEPEDSSYLAVFRIFWGLIMTYEATTYMAHDWGKFRSAYYSSSFHFQYWGFKWAQVPANPFYLKLVFIALMVAGIMITLGFLYRLAAISYFMLFTYHYVLEQAIYLNHFYLVCLLSSMMVVLPCNCCYSLDAWIWPSISSPSVPKWCLWVVRAELVIVYTYAGINKINEDWLRAQPLRQWLSNRGDLPGIGIMLQYEFTAWFFSYGGMIYDLFIGALLLWRPTLGIGVILTMIFHLTNKLVFNIGIFPWMMIVSTCFFFDPDWPVWFWFNFTNRPVPVEENPPAPAQDQPQENQTPPQPVGQPQPQQEEANANQNEPQQQQQQLRWPEYVPRIPVRSFSQIRLRKLTLGEKLLLLLLMSFLLQQALFPMRWMFYPGTTAWNEYGHKFSWRMKLRSKSCHYDFFGYQPTVNTTENATGREVMGRAFHVPDDRILTPKQRQKVGSRPELLVQYSKYLAKVFSVNGTDAEIYAHVWCQLNGRPWQRLNDPEVNLAEQSIWEEPRSWVYEIDPLSPELEAEFPWNWDWSWDAFWKRMTNRRTPEMKKQEQKERKAQNAARSQQARMDFSAMVTKRRRTQNSTGPN